MDRRFDPRSIVTPYAFAVHPDLLGRPLATPLQRAGAILIDLIVIGMISQIGAAPLLAILTVLFLWLAFRGPGKDLFGKIFRIALGCLGFILLCVTVVVIAVTYFQEPILRFFEESGITIETVQDSTGEGGQAPEVEGLGALVEFGQGALATVALRNAETSEEAQGLIVDLAQGGLAIGLSRGEIRETLMEVIPADAPWQADAQDMVDRAIDALSGRQEGPPEAGAPAQEAEGGVEEGLEPEDFSPAATDSIERLEQAIRLAEEDKADLEESLERTESELEEERSQGLLDRLTGLIDDIGLGSIWGALYLTITHTWWRGTTVGKRIFRIRVVMIDKRPLNWWLSFERVGGYAAGFATGLLGFAQIFWDPNRQAIHDKVSETIVIQDGRDPVPGPWIEEGRAQWARGRQEAGVPPAGKTPASKTPAG